MTTAPSNVGTRCSRRGSSRSVCPSELLKSFVEPPRFSRMRGDCLKALGFEPGDHRN